MKQIIDLLPNQPHVCLVVKQAFGAQMCQQLVAEKKHSFTKAITHYPTSYRNNDRQVVDDDRLSTLLFEEIKQYIPQQINTKGVGKHESGNWQLKRLNNRLRLCRYQPQQYFNKHLDGVHYESATVQSKLTFMVYLNGNEEFEGGRTLFFPSKTSDEIVQEYLPEAGDLIIFDHNIWHSGEVLQSGVKYILRSDILYEKITPEAPLVNQAFAEGHLGYIWAIAKNENYIFTGGRDKLLKMWDYDGKLMAAIQAHENSVLAILPYGNDLIITASRDQTVRCWAIDRLGKKIHFQRAWKTSPHTATILNLCKIDHKRFASLGADGMVQVITVGGSMKQAWKAHDEWVWAMAKMNETCLLTCSEDGSLKWWNYKKKALLGQWTESNVPANSLAFDEATQLLFVARSNGVIECFRWDNAQSKLTPLHSIQAHEGIIRCLKIYEHYLISGGEDNQVNVWNVSDFAHTLPTLSPAQTYSHNNFVQDVLVLGNKLISVSYDGQIIING